MGVVWEAEQEQPKRRVALKVMRRDHVVDELHARMFRREAESLARLKHPNIAAIYESGHTAEGHDYFAMELVRGATLDEWLASRPSRIDDAELELRLRLFCTLCDAVHYAHQRGVIHRDLKPSNIIVTDGRETSAGGSRSRALPTVKILDFGLARITDSDIAATLVSEVGVIKGTLPYMSPEQARGDVAAIDVRADVYALGIILYELLTSSRPYDVSRAALAEAVRVICEQPPTPLRQSWNGVRRVDRDLETVVGKSLEKEAERRYDSAAALGDDVDRYLCSQPILARAPSATYQLTKMIQRNRLGAAFATTVLILLVVLAATMSVQAGRIARERDRAERETAKARAVNHFMRETLGAANPSIMGYDVTVVEALGQAAALVEQTFAGQPEIEAEVRHTLGETLSALGRYTEAEPQLEAALALRAELLGRDHPETLASLASLAQLAWRDSRFEDAVELANQVLEARRRVHGEHSSEVAVTLDLLGRVLVDAGRFDEAEPLIQQALSMSREIHGEQSLQVATCYQTWAVLEETARQDFARSEELHRKDLLIRRAVQDHDTLETGSVINNVAMSVMRQGRLDEAAALMEESNAIVRRLAGDRHPTMARGLENLGNVFFRLGDYERTLDLLTEAISVRREVFGDDSPEVARGLTNLGAVYRRSGNLTAAETTLRDAVARMERAYGPEHSDVASAHRSLARVLHDQGRIREAEAEYRTALAIAERAFAADSAGLAGYRHALGSMLIEQRRFAEAEPLLVSAFQIHRDAAGADDRRTATAASTLVELYEGWGRPADAARYRRDDGVD
jgi:tetratricopeptide (TPR) repeat protein/tRNA A-37 threonylcarbamoyl transferase component Bud32